MTRGIARLVAALASVSVSASLGTTARAELPLDVELSACDAELRAERVRALLEIEIGELAAPAGREGRPRLAITCAGDCVLLSLEDPVTDKRVERALPAPEGAGRERVLALASSQLLIASWAELLVERASTDEDRVARRGEALPRPEVGAAMAADALERARAAVSRAVVRREERTALSLSLRAGARARQLDHPLVTGRIALEGLGEIAAGIGVGAHLFAERGLTHRDAGDVELLVVGGGLTIAARPLEADAGALTVGATVEVGDAAFVGQPSLASVVAGRVEGVWVDVGGRVGGEAHLGVLRIGLELEVGATLAGPRGEVDLDTAADPLGLHVGLALVMTVR